MTDQEILDQVRANPGLKTAKEKAAAIYGAIAALAFSGEIDRAKHMSVLASCKWDCAVRPLAARE